MSETASICDVLPAVAAVLGLPDADDRLDLRERVGDVRRVALVLVDGMGHRLLPLLAPHAPLLASVLDGTVGRLDELSCTFPSTTPTSLVSLGTGVLPGAHGVLGFTLNVPGTDRVLTHILWRDDPPPRAWQPAPTWFQRIAASGCESRIVMPALFEGSGLTDAAYRGATFCALARGEDAAARLLRELAAGPGLSYGYTAALDTAAHVFGVDSPQWRSAAAKVDAYLMRIVDGLPDDAVLLVTADHGGLNAGERIDMDADPALSNGVRLVAGEPRVRYLHVRDGAAHDVLATWRETFGDRADVLCRDAAIADDLFGPVPAEHRDRIGDIVVICNRSTVVLATEHEPPEVSKLIGFHGARTPAETAIPLISIRR